ncbi:unnamed protein product, partial [Porites lobata]
TDEQFSFDENEAISEPSLSGKDSFLSTNVSVSSLKLVLDRLADRQTNFVEQERAIASVLSKVDEVKFVEFVASVAGLFEQCFGLRSSKQNKHLRAIELERNFTERRSKTNPASIKAWEDILLHAGVAKCVASDNQGNISRPAAQEAVDDIVEIDAVRDHAGWAIKRAREISSTEDKLRIKQSSGDDTWSEVDKSVALELLSKLGKDEKQQDGRFRFIPRREVGEFFLSLHVVVDNLLCKSQFVVEKEKVVTNCLQHLSRDQQLRKDWVTHRRFSKPVAVFVLQKVCIMFVKSKKQVARDKFALKPQKRSVALREELRGKIGKSSGVKGQQNKNVVSPLSKSPPEIVLKLRRNFESPEIVTNCLKEICTQPDKNDILIHLSGKELSRLLSALGQPALDGKKKTRQVDVLLAGNEEFIIKYPEKVDR